MGLQDPFHKSHEKASLLATLSHQEQRLCSSLEASLCAGRLGDILGSRTTPHSFPCETFMKCCILDRHLLVIKLTLSETEKNPTFNQYSQLSQVLIFTMQGEGKH